MKKLLVLGFVFFGMVANAGLLPSEISAAKKYYGNNNINDLKGNTVSADVLVGEAKVKFHSLVNALGGSIPTVYQVAIKDSELKATVDTFALYWKTPATKTEAEAYHLSVYSSDGDFVASEKTDKKTGKFDWVRTANVGDLIPTAKIQAIKDFYEASGLPAGDVVAEPKEKLTESARRHYLADYKAFEKDNELPQRKVGEQRNTLIVPEVYMVKTNRGKTYAIISGKQNDPKTISIFVADGGRFIARGLLDSKKKSITKWTYCRRGLSQIQ